MSEQTLSWRPIFLAESAEAQLTQMESAGLIDRRLDVVPELQAELGTAACAHPVWVVFPWSRLALRILDRRPFAQLRLSRNSGQLTAEEQEVLSRAQIGVIGLSVGNIIARTLVLEGVGGWLRLADPDVLMLSNLNRVLARLQDVGLPKVVLAARQIAELDPFVEVDIVRQGVVASSIDAFLHRDGRPLDLVIEECDDLAIKRLVRARARALGVPVLMHTSAGPRLDIERFDVEPERGLLHGLLDDVPADSRQWRSAEVIRRLAGVPSANTRLSSAVDAVLSGALPSWPQLGADVVHGAYAVVTAARRILLGLPMPSGRYELGAALQAPGPVATP